MDEKKINVDEKRRFIIETATRIYFENSIKERSTFFKNYVSNGWDVYRIFEECLQEAKYLWQEIENELPTYQPEKTFQKKIIREDTEINSVNTGYTNAVENIQNEAKTSEDLLEYAQRMRDEKMENEILQSI
jgi:hypothetical protein